MSLSLFYLRRAGGWGEVGQVVSRTTEWILVVTSGRYPRFTTLSPCTLRQPSERSRTNGTIPPNPTRLISNHPLQLDSDHPLQEDPISPPLSRNSTRSGLPSSPRSSTSIPMSYLSALSLTCSLWTTSSPPRQTSDGQTFSILESWFSHPGKTSSRSSWTCSRTRAPGTAPTKAC